MPLPAKVTWVTFDVYGTLIDWEAGILDAFHREAQREGFTLQEPEKIFPRFLELEHEIESGSYELYAEVLRRCAVTIAKEIGWPLEPSRSGFLPDSMPRWRPFKETNTQLTRFGKKFSTGLISNVTYASVSLASYVPPAAKTCWGYFGADTSNGTGVYIASSATGIGASFSECGGASIYVKTDFAEKPFITAQTLYYRTSTTYGFVGTAFVSGYSF